MAKVAVIVPARNEGAWLKHTIESMIKNAGYFDDYRIIVVDDASNDGSAEQVKDIDKVTVLTVSEMEEHGPAVCRNRGLDYAESIGAEYVITTDAHMAFSNGWLAKLYDAIVANPTAIIQSVSTGYRSVVNKQVIELDKDTASNLEKIKKVTDVWKDKEAVILEYPNDAVPKGEDKKKAAERIMRYLQCPVRLANIKNPTLFIKDIVLDQYLSDSFLCYGANLEYDPEDRNFFTPKWSYLYGKTLKPGIELVPCTAVMGACYIVSVKMLRDRIGGWTRYSEWVHEEELLSTAWVIQGLPIYCLSTVYSAHNYNRHTASILNQSNQNQNKWAITEIVFDDMKEEIRETIWGSNRVLMEYPEWVHLYRMKVQSGRVYTDAQFLTVTGLDIYFIPKVRKRVAKRIKAKSDEPVDIRHSLTQATAPEVAKAFEEIRANRAVRYLFCVASMDNFTDKGEYSSTAVWQMVSAQQWDTAKNERSNIVNLQMHDEMLGRVKKVFFQQLGLEAFRNTITPEQIEKRLEHFRKELRQKG